MNYFLNIPTCYNIDVPFRWHSATLVERPKKLSSSFASKIPQGGLASCIERAEIWQQWRSKLVCVSVGTVFSSKSAASAILPSLHSTPKYRPMPGFMIEMFLKSSMTPLVLYN